MSHTYHQLYVTSNQPELLKKRYHPTEQQLQNAKMSLIEKHKMSNGIQHLLFCRNQEQYEVGYISANQKELIESQKKKYLDFMRKNYNQRIPEELTNLTKLKARIKEFQNKAEVQQKIAIYQRQGRGLMEQELMTKKRKNEQNKATAGKKKVKADQKAEPKSKKTKDSKKNEDKGISEKMNQKQIEIQPQNIIAQEEASQSLGLDLLNSIQHDEQYEDGYDQE